MQNTISTTTNLVNQASQYSPVGGLILAGVFFSVTVATFLWMGRQHVAKTDARVDALDFEQADIHNIYRKTRAKVLDKLEVQQLEALARETPHPAYPTLVHPNPPRGSMADFNQALSSYLPPTPYPPIDTIPRMTVRFHQTELRGRAPDWQYLRCKVAQDKFNGPQLLQLEDDLDHAVEELGNGDNVYVDNILIAFTKRGEDQGITFTGRYKPEELEFPTQFPLGGGEPNYSADIANQAYYSVVAYSKPSWITKVGVGYDQVVRETLASYMVWHFPTMVLINIAANYYFNPLFRLQLNNFVSTAYSFFYYRYESVVLPMDMMARHILRTYLQLFQSLLRRIKF